MVGNRKQEYSTGLKMHPSDFKSCCFAKIIYSGVAGQRKQIEIGRLHIRLKNSRQFTETKTY